MAVANARHSVFLMLLSVANVSSYRKYTVSVAFAIAPKKERYFLSDQTILTCKQIIS